jgi:hypothetical protein
MFLSKKVGGIIGSGGAEVYRLDHSTIDGNCSF